MTGAPPETAERDRHRQRRVAGGMALAVLATLYGPGSGNWLISIVMIAIGGVIPPGDYAALTAAGAAAIFPPGTVIAEAAAKLIRALNERLGYAARQAAE